MTSPFRRGDDEADAFRAANALVKKAQQAREAEEKAAGDRLQSQLREEMYRRNPERRP